MRRTLEMKNASSRPTASSAVPWRRGAGRFRGVCHTTQTRRPCFPRGRVRTLWVAHLGAHFCPLFLSAPPPPSPFHNIKCRAVAHWRKPLFPLAPRAWVSTPPFTPILSVKFTCGASWRTLFVTFPERRTTSSSDVPSLHFCANITRRAGDSPRVGGPALKIHTFVISSLFIKSFI